MPLGVSPALNPGAEDFSGETPKGMSPSVQRLFFLTAVKTGNNVLTALAQGVASE
jgi:hypothetical protein